MFRDKTDDECFAIFDDLKLDFEYVFRNLLTINATQDLSAREHLVGGPFESVEKAKESIPP